MNYGQFRDQVLKILNQYSIAGNRVLSTYNNQQDYLSRIPGFLNDAMMEIATTAKKIPVVVALSSLMSEEIGDQIRYYLPDDFYQFRTGGIVRLRDGELVHTNSYCTQGRQYLLVPKDDADSYEVSYYRYPALVPDPVTDDAELDNTPETHYAAAFYVAAHLAAHDDMELSGMLHNAYEDKLAKMSPGVHAEVHAVSDAYRFFG